VGGVRGLVRRLPGGGGLVPLRVGLVRVHGEYIAPGRSRRPVLPLDVFCE
jgi:hypothetical protein